MQNDVLAKIDTLIQMSDCQSDINALRIQLSELEKTITKKENELKLIKNSINEDKYYDESAEIVDKNIEISLNKKIKNLKKSLIDIESQLSDELAKENELNLKLEQLKKEIEEKENFLDILDEKIEMLSNDEKENFENLKIETKEKLEKAKKQYNSKKKCYDKIQGKLEVLSFSKSEFERKIEDESSKLIDVKANLLNKRNYINNDLKAEDDQKISDLSKEISTLKKEKLELEDNPLMIAEKAREYLNDEDYTGTLKEIEKLKNIILKQAYMDVEGLNASENLNIELENAKAKRDEFASMINSKNYESVDTTLIKDRLSYIKEIKENCIKSIDEIKEKIKNIDNIELDDLCKRINYCENEAETLKKKIDEFKNGINDEELSLSRKVSLQTSLIKKEEELENIQKLMSSYRKDRNSLIITSFNLEKNEISKLEQRVEQINEEIKKLNKLVSSTNKSKDTIAIENDKNYLKELNENIKAIKKRQSFDKSPNEIYKEIELLLGKNINSIDNNDTNIEDNLNKNLNNEIDLEDDSNDKIINEESKTDEIITADDLINDSINDSLGNNLNENDLNQLSILNSSEVNDSNNATGNEDIKLKEDKQQIEPVTIDSLPVVDNNDLEVNITDLNDDEKKLKVINVERLNDNTSDETLENNEFLIGDYIS
mgnify:FL=1